MRVEKRERISMDYIFSICFRRRYDGQIAYNSDPPREAIALDGVMRGMAAGTTMHKMKDTEKLYKRKYKVDLQNMKLTYSPSRKPLCWTKNPDIDLYDVEEVRIGWGTDTFNTLQSKVRRRRTSLFAVFRNYDWAKEENCFSIVCSGNKILNLVAPNEKTRDAWVRGLRHLLATCKNSKIKKAHGRWLMDQVRRADVNNNGSLNFEECLALLHNMNISMDKKEVLKLFNSANFRKSQVNGEESLDPDEFVRFYDALTRRPELEELMIKYSVSRTALLGPDELRNFIQKEQKVDVTVSDCEHIIDHHEPREDKIPGYMSLKGFTKYMLSNEERIVRKRHRIIYQDMKHPLSHYYIASSHNTYLLYGQLVGSSSVEGYIKALLRGCRCLELDTYDGKDGEPEVFHGYTLTTSILLRDILTAIKEYAFRNSQYPLILSIENHCSIRFQKKMARHFNTILGEYLYKNPIKDDETDLPSPEKLARKILIKAKKSTATTSQEEEDYNEEEGSENDRQLPVEEIDGRVAAAPMKHSGGGVAKELSDLVNYCSPSKFESFGDCMMNWKFYQMASFQEVKAERLATESGASFVSYNKRNLSRIYPKGTRTDSSNYDPVQFWNVGCQLVALNYQTMDKNMYLNEAKFAQNGRCGYVLKPRFLYDETIPYDPAEKPDPSYQQFLTVTVISAQHLPRLNTMKEGEIVDPYVSIKVVGHPLDSQKKKTSYVQDNGFNPVWKEMFLMKLNMPELAIIWFKVKDQNFTGKNEMLGQYAIPFTSMAEGYRHIILENKEGHSIAPASLFVKVTVGKYNTPEPYKKFLPSGLRR